MIAAVAADPFDRAGVPFVGDQVAGIFREGGKGIVVDLGTCDDGHRVVEQVDEHSQHAGLSLAAQSQKEQVVARENRVDDLGNDGLVVADNSGKQRFAASELGQQVPPHLVFDADGLPSAGAQLPKGLWSVAQLSISPRIVRRAGS